MELIINCTNTLAYNPAMWYHITIRDRCKNLLFATNTTSETIRVCCCASSVVVSVSLYLEGIKTQEITRYVNCAREKQITMNFGFVSIAPMSAMQQFILIDKTYQLPINSAKLRFTSP